MAGPQSCAVISVEVFIEQQEILPMRIGLEFLRSSVHRPPARGISQKDPGQSIGNFPGYLEQVHQVARTGGTLNLEAVAVIQEIRQQSADEHRVYRHPNGTSPVGVATVHACVGFGGKIVDAVLLTFDRNNIRMLRMKAGKRPYS